MGFLLGISLQLILTAWKIICNCSAKATENFKILRTITVFTSVAKSRRRQFSVKSTEHRPKIGVGVEHTHEIPELLNFYMGTNTAERRRYIMENLV